MKERIKVRNSGIIKLQYFNDYPDGSLVIAEAKKNIPFEIKRVYYITHLHCRQAIRGKHAHKKIEQIMFCLQGSFTLKLDDGKNKQKIAMNNPCTGVRIGRLLWHTMTKFSKDCVILVLANGYYKESDYIRDYKTFLKYVVKKINNY